MREGKLRECMHLAIKDFSTKEGKSGDGAFERCSARRRHLEKFFAGGRKGKTAPQWTRGGGEGS